MDKSDRKILEALQEDASIPLAELADRVGLTATPCWRRVQRLEEKGWISKRVALLNPMHLNLGVTVFVSIRTNSHDMKWLAAFHGLVSAIPEVVDFYRLAGQADYLLRVVVPDIAAYDRVYKRLISGSELADVTSSFAMEKIKSTTKLPLDYA
ncbi:Lrp/AsnC family transcriptional regulator [Variovorax rhizosphaerae]|uniref:Lrp/AsnC family transcriptional regulator n=1 Tax=Variovorax rhizosphaerae TaxID=1836200 RepID=A0ABU8WJA5_9BURK